MTQVVVSLTYQFLSVEEGIDQKTTAGNQAGDPVGTGVAACFHLAHGHVVLSETADARPVADPHVLDAGKEDLEDATTQVVCDQ